MLVKEEIYANLHSSVVGMEKQQRYEVGLVIAKVVGTKLVSRLKISFIYLHLKPYDHSQ